MDRTDSAAGAEAPEGVVAVRPEAEVLSRQQIPYFIGISGQSAGATGVSMNLVVIPPGGRAAPHVHRGFETALYVLKGRVETHYGPRLRRSVVTEAGDFLFVAADVPHQPVNLSPDEPALAIVARNDADEQEHVIAYDPETDRLIE